MTKRDLDLLIGVAFAMGIAIGLLIGFFASTELLP